MGEITLEGLKDAFLYHLTVVENYNDDVRYKELYQKLEEKYTGNDKVLFSTVHKQFILLLKYFVNEARTISGQSCYRTLLSIEYPNIKRVICVLEMYPCTALMYDIEDHTTWFVLKDNDIAKETKTDIFDLGSDCFEEILDRGIDKIKSMVAEVLIEDLDINKFDW